MRLVRPAWPDCYSGKASLAAVYYVVRFTSSTLAGVCDCPQVSPWLVCQKNSDELVQAGLGLEGQFVRVYI